MRSTPRSGFRGNTFPSGCHGQLAYPCPPLALADQPNTVRHKFTALCIGGTLIWSAPALTALWLPGAECEPRAVWQVARPSHSGSGAPALQRAKAPVLGLGQENFPDNIGTNRQWHPDRRLACQIHILVCHAYDCSDTAH